MHAHNATLHPAGGGGHSRSLLKIKGPTVCSLIQRFIATPSVLEHWLGLGPWCVNFNMAGSTILTYSGVGGPTGLHYILPR